MKSTKRNTAERCEYCGEPLAPARARVFRQRGTRRVIFERVPALVCRTCGHRVFEPDAVEAMERVLESRVPRGRAVRVSLVSA